MKNREGRLRNNRQGADRRVRADGFHDRGGGREHFVFRRDRTEGNRQDVPPLPGCQRHFFVEGSRLRADPRCGSVPFEKSYRPEKVLSATGAGDTTIAAFLYAVMQGYGWNECVQLATAEGATCVETYDAISGLRSLEELKGRIDAGWEKQDLACCIK